MLFADGGLIAFSAINERKWDDAESESYPQGTRHLALLAIKSLLLLRAPNNMICLQTLSSTAD